MANESGAIRLGRTLKMLRESKGFAIEEVAREGGFEPEVLRSIEDGERPPRFGTLRFLAEKYGEGVLPIVMDLKVPQSLSKVTPEVGAISYGIGRTEREAELNKRRAKAEQVPRYDLGLPSDLTEPEFTAALLNQLHVIEHLAVVVNTILRDAPEHIADPHFRLVSRLWTRDIFFAAGNIIGSVVERHETSEGATDGAV